MRCKNCGKRLREKEKFCTICGYYNGDSDDDIKLEGTFNGLLPDDEPNLLDESTYETIEEDNGIEEFSLKANSSGTKDDEFFYKDEKFLEAYIGEDYKLIKKSPFNIYAFLLNWMYVLYRKMYIIGIIGMIITGIVFLLRPKFIVVYLIVAMVIIGLTFNKLYIYVSKLKVEFMLKKLQGTDRFTLENICEKKGGVKVVPALVIYLIFLIIIFFGMFNVYYNKNNNTNFWNENSENRATCDSLLKTSYKELEKNPVTGTLNEGLCSITKSSNSPKKYDVYLKINNDNVVIYVHYETNGKYLEYDNNTEGIQQLEAKNVNRTITDEEMEELKKKRKIEEDYYQGQKKSAEEEDLIKNNKNTSERKNFVFQEKEIIR